MRTAVDDDGGVGWECNFREKSPRPVPSNDNYAGVDSARARGTSFVFARAALPKRNITQGS